MFYKHILKRFLDLCLVFILFIPFSILMVLTYLLIWITMGRPCIFAQARPGYKNKIFYLYKFRTMTNATDFQGNLLDDGKRLTGLGKFLRKCSLDELPQLFNVLKGDMSWIGPRPLLTEYLPHYNSNQIRRHDVKPGITGWSQVKGRNNLPWDKKIDLDLWYVDHVSLVMDIKIIFFTLLVICRGKGVSAEGHATMPKFTDSL